MPDLTRIDDVRIVKITYRSNVNGRVAIVFAKVPYGGMFDLAEKMARLLAKRQVRWFRIDAAKTPEIMPIRTTLTRWPEALAESTARTKIDVLA